MMATYETDANVWIFYIINTFNHEDLTKCLVTLWDIRFARRKAIHEGQFQIPLSTHSFVESFLPDQEIASTSKVKPQPITCNTHALKRGIASPLGVA
jgi:hypothetical protein